MTVTSAPRKVPVLRREQTGRTAAEPRRKGRPAADPNLEKPIADALDLVPEDVGGAKGVCRIGTLILANACLLERRLRDVLEVRLMLGPDRVGGAESPEERTQGDMGGGYSTATTRRCSARRSPC